MVESRMLELAEELLNRSKSGKVKWEEGPFRNSYTVKFPDIETIISREVDFYVLNLVNDRRTITASLTPPTRDASVNEVLREIYDLARSKVLNTPNSIDKALEYLRRE
jgi:hypothetical protein